MPQVEADITLQCVSNEVGGDLVGTARWQGVLLRDVLARAGVRRAAEQVLGTSTDGFTAGFPVAVRPQRQPGHGGARHERRAAARSQHGFPARLRGPRPVRLRVGDQVAASASP